MDFERAVAYMDVRPWLQALVILGALALSLGVAALLRAAEGQSVFY